MPQDSTTFQREMSICQVFMKTFKNRTKSLWKLLRTETCLLFKFSFRWFYFKDNHDHYFVNKSKFTSTNKQFESSLFYYLSRIIFKNSLHIETSHRATKLEEIHQSYQLFSNFEKRKKKSQKIFMKIQSMQRHLRWACVL